MYFSYSGWQFSQLRIDSVGGFLHGNLVPALQEYVGAFGAEAVGYHWSVWLLDNPRFLISTEYTDTLETFWLIAL